MLVVVLPVAEYSTYLSDNRIGYAIEVELFCGTVNDEHCMLIRDEPPAILLLHGIVGSFFLNDVCKGQ